MLLSVPYFMNNAVGDERVTKGVSVSGRTEHGSAERVHALLASVGPNGRVPSGRAFGNLVATFTLSNLQTFELSQTHTWGLDLSQSLHGAGGVGGLLGVEELSGTHTGVYHFVYDANGNVSEVLDSAGSIAAHYEYSPFGEVVRSSGSYADANPFRFSTKYWDDETGLYFYGYRHYDPATGRWLNRDPIGELGGLNLYAFVKNRPLNVLDFLGLDSITLMDEQGAGGFGHTGKLVGNDNSGWDYYSYGPDESASSWDMLKGDDVPADFDHQQFDTLQDAADSPDLEHYDEFQRREQNPEQDDAERQSTEDFAQNDYNLYDHNCDDCAAAGEGGYESPGTRPEKNFDDQEGSSDQSGDWPEDAVCG